MNKLVVVYKSKYGSTKKYAEWIAESLNIDLFEYTEVNLEELVSYETIIYGGGLYASGINGKDLIAKNFNALRNKNIIIFTVGLAATDDKDIFIPIIDKNFTEEMKTKIKFFHLRGGIDYNELTFIHKKMMGMLKMVVSKKKPEDMTEEDKMMLDTYGDKVDFTDKTTIEPIISYVNGSIK